MDVLSDALVVRFDPDSRSVIIEHAGQSTVATLLVQIRPETYSTMAFEQMAEFLGSRLLLLMPSMRAAFASDILRMEEQP